MGQAPHPAPPPAGFDDDDPMLAALAAVTATLAAWNADSETAYLQVGEDLQAIHAMLKAVEGAMARTIEIMTGPDIRLIDAHLSDAAGRADALQANADAIGDRLGAVLDGRARAMAGNDQVVRAFSLLDYVTLVARTHTAALMAGAMMDRGSRLSAFLAQVGGLVATGRTLAGQLSVRLMHLHLSLQAAADQLRDRQMDEDRSRPLRAVIGLLEQDLTARRLTADGNRQGARLAFAEAARAVAGVVGVLQFHDIARQRLEHSVAHLRLLLDLARGGALEPGEAPPAPRARAVIMARIAQLERAQLDDLARLYQARMAAIAASLDLILDQARDGAGMLGGMLQIDRQAMDGDADGQPGLGITRQARDLEQRFLQGEARRGTILTSLADCIKAAAQFAAMTDALDDVEFSLRLAGFNAAIHAADHQNGGGAMDGPAADAPRAGGQRGGDPTIGYIAHEIRDNAATAKAGADLIRIGIGIATKAAADLQSVLLPTEIAEAGAIRDLLSGVLGAVGRAEQDCLDQLAEAEAAAAAVPAKVARAKDLMTAHLTGLMLMQSAGDALDPLATDAAGADDEGVDLAPLEALLSRHYTMKEERLILAAVFGRPAPSVSGPSVSGPSYPDPAGADPWGGDDSGSATPGGGEADDLSDVFF